MSPLSGCSTNERDQNKLTVRAGTRSATRPTIDRWSRYVRRDRPGRRPADRRAFLLCLASLLAGCSNDGAAPSNPPASTQQAELRSRLRLRCEPKRRPTPSPRACMRCSRRCAAGASPAARDVDGSDDASSAGAARPGSTDIRHRATRRRERRNRRFRAVRMRVSSQSSCAPRKPSSHHPTAERRVALPPASAGRVRRRSGLSSPGRLRQVSSPPAAVRAGCPRTLPPANSCSRLPPNHSDATDTHTRSAPSPATTPTTPSTSPLPGPADD